ncbi:MAG: SPFH domain-containing protein [Anaerolineae bacterium]|jgi:uncharacterized membrane protein YqiK|nr:SPFH domain-containing protein [Anaerolineae bacterium]
MSTEMFLVIGFGVIVFFLLFIFPTLGLVIINNEQIGIVKRKIGKPLPPGKIVALNGEAGLQADTLATGWYFGYFWWLYDVKRVPLVTIAPGEIALLVAADGRPTPPGRILARIVQCDNFQDARKFITNGGEKGRQLGILTAGRYKINTELFTVITSRNATQLGLEPGHLRVYQVLPDKVGIVTTLDGRPIDEGEIAGLYIPNHDNFQNAQAFIDAGGQRGLQEQVLLSGSWNLNPWFVQVEQVPMTEVPIGYVGVIVSFIGKAHQDVSGVDFKHGDLVNVGHKGVWTTPLYPGKHPINTQVMRVELVPTTNIVLNWASRTEAHNYDQRLNSITVRSRDGFAFDLDVAQIIHVGAPEAPKVISRVGSVQNLVDHVLQPIVGNYFRNAAQNYTVLDFLSARSERQSEASTHISKAINSYDVQAIDTLIGNINPPAELMTTLTDRKIAEEQKKTFEVQQAAQTQRQQLVRETAIADSQGEIVKAERGVNIADLNAQSLIKQATGDAEAIRRRALGEAEAIRSKGEAQADAYRVGAAAIGQEGFTAVQLMQIIGERNIRIIPELAVNGGGANNSGVIDALLAVMLRDRMPIAKPVDGNVSITNGHSAKTES